jgi:hypothetical protein
MGYVACVDWVSFGKVQGMMHVDSFLTKYLKKQYEKVAHDN